MKKSQIPSQMFTYIFILLVIGMLMFFGVKWIGTIMNKEEEISKAKTKVSIENAFEEIKHNFGSWENEVFRVPSEVDRVCFLDQGMSEMEIANTPFCSEEPLICDAWEAQDQAVVFDPIDAMEMSIDVQDVKVDEDVNDGNGYLCVNNTNGRVKVKLTGQGDAVKVSEAD